MRGYFGIGVWHPKTEANIGTLWRHAGLFGASFVFTIGRRYRHQSSDTRKTPGVIPLYHYDDIDSMLGHAPFGCQVVCIEMDERAKPLQDAYHPERAIYLLGAEDHGLPEEILFGRQKMMIETPSEDESMNVSVAGTIVMYDRFLKTEIAARRHHSRQTVMA